MMQIHRELFYSVCGFFCATILFFASTVFAATLPQVKTYEQLVTEIKMAQQAAHQPPNKLDGVREAWTIGKLVEIHVAQHTMWADYSQDVDQWLSRDLGFTLRELQEKRYFARIFPEGIPPYDLGWGHYYELLDVKDAKLRDEMARQAEQEHWTRETLRQELKKRLLVPAAQNSNAKNPESIFASSLYTYKAIVKQVIDGDTFDAAVDLGFGLTTRQRFRLANDLNAPELGTQEGLASKTFLVEQFTQNPNIIIKVHGLDKFRRYLAEVWINNKNLNEEILKKGFASPKEY